MRGEGEGWGEGVSEGRSRRGATSTDARYLRVFTRYFALFFLDLLLHIIVVVNRI